MAESDVNSCMKLQTSRVVSSGKDLQSTEEQVSLSLTAPLLDNIAPLFTLSVSGTDNREDIKIMIIESRTKITYGTKP